MAQAYVPIQTVTVGSSGSASIEFNNIPQNYTDLCILLSLRSARVDTDDTIRIDFNSFAGTNLSSRRLEGNGASASSTTDASNISFRTLAANHTASTFGNTIIYIPNYAGSNNKSVSIDNVTENNATTAWASLSAGLWSSSSAITAIKVFSANSANFAQHSTATLYGIGGARASGGTITADARYTYHTFTSSGTFTTLEKIKGAEILVVAGGGSGGNNGAGGGGAGGVVYGTPQQLTSGTSYSVTVGSGGAGTTVSSGLGGAGNNGTNSSFASLTAIGGGTSGGWNGSAFVNGTSGGSGGGGVSNLTPPSSNQTTSGINFIGYGNSGGSGGGGGPYSLGGGGGGAGAAGSNANTTSGGAGGLGTTLFSAWGSATSTGENINGRFYYAGGGGGAGDLRQDGYGNGPGGPGGGGAADRVASNATANTGGGGGGAAFGNGSAQTSGNGGSGLVIIRYPN